MNPRDLTPMVPDDAGVNVHEMAALLRADVGDVKTMVECLRKQWLVTVSGEIVFATDELRNDRRNGLLPMQLRQPKTAFERHEAAVKKADGISFKANPKMVLEYMAIWGCDGDDLKRRFKLTRRDLDAVIRHLGCEGLLDVCVTKKWGFLERAHANVPDEVSALMQKRFLTHSTEGRCGRVFRTELDVLADLVRAFSPLSLDKAASRLRTSPEVLLPVAETLHDFGIIKLRHKGRASLLEGVEEKTPRNEAEGSLGREIVSYQISKDDIQVNAALLEYEGEVKYRLGFPTFTEATQAMLSKIYEKANPGAIGFEINKSADFEALKCGLRRSIADAIDSQLPFVDERTRKVMVCELTNEMHLGRLEYLLKDPNIEEIKAQGGRPVFIKHMGCRQEWMETNLTLENDMLGRYSKAVARETAQQVDASHPLMDAVLHTGDRINVSVPEAAAGSYVLEVRVFSKRPWNIVRLMRKGTVNAEVLAFLWLALQYRFNILVSGETGSGKTSFVNSLGIFLPKNDHIISVEDTREIQLPTFYRNWTCMTTRAGNKDQEVTMNRLLVNALRMNPSFIILGEVRGRQDIETLMRATAMGHPVLSTIHTRDCSTTIKRFEDAGVAACDLANIHINVILEAVKSKTDSQPKRRVKEVGEYVLEGGRIAANRIYRLDMNADRLLRVNEPRNYNQRVMEKVNMNKEDIRRDLEGKKRIIEWLADKGVEDIETLGRVIQMYYRDPVYVVDAAAGHFAVEEVVDDEG